MAIPNHLLTGMILQAANLGPAVFWKEFCTSWKIQEIRGKYIMEFLPFQLVHTFNERGKVTFDLLLVELVLKSGDWNPNVW